VASDRDTILRFFYDEGFLDAGFQYTVKRETSQRVSLTYTVDVGPRSYVRSVVVMGLHNTRYSLVDDRISLNDGDPLSLTKQADTERRLSDLGIFSRVDSAIQNPEGPERSKTILYDLTEARHYALTVGVGAQIGRIGGGVTSLDNPAGTTGFAPRLALGITRENFLGLAQTIGLQTAVSTIEQRAALTYFIPQFVSNDKLSLTTTALIDLSNDIRTFSSDRREVSMQLGQQVSRALTVQYRLVFRHVSETNLKINPLLVPILAQPETVGLAEVSFIEDRRDDPTDAHHGVYTTLDLGYAPQMLGSQTQFARGLVRNSTYHALGRNLVFARSTQFGAIARTGGHPSIPLPERLYSGGSTSIRAFPDFQAGPRDLVTGFPLGGNALFINNFELRFPLYGDNLGGVIFQDAGNVYASATDISLRFRQQNLQDFNYMVQDAGFGIRYRTPIGPLRVDLSFSPDAPRFFGLKGTLQDYINGTAKSTVQKINAFQFHISLGQAF
jgi:outer membrane protein assembly factor BamA